MYDAISISKCGEVDYIFEIKYLFSTNSWNAEIWHSIPYRMKNQASTYSRETGRQAVLVLLIVTLEDQIQQVTNMVDRRLKSADTDLIVKIIPENEIEILGKDNII